MCDYSIRHVTSRPAKVDDQLVTTSFGAPTNRGFAAVGEPNVAVCLLPGTELALEKVPEYYHPLGYFFPSLRSWKTGGHKVARFRQINEHQIGVHHDALEFPNGKTVLIADLFEGLHAAVLQLPASRSPESKKEEQQSEQDLSTVSG